MSLINTGSAYSRITDPLKFVKDMGISIAQSGMFGCENERQGEVLAMACLARRLDPMSIPQEYHLMHGRLVLRADAMLGRLARAGGSYLVISHTPECAEIEVEYKGRKYRERLTWEDARKEPFVYDGKPKDIMPLLLAGQFEKLKVSSNYATPRRRMQHLWARVCSDAVRVIAPDLVTGNYTPEEATEFTGKPIPAAIETAAPATVEESEAREAIEERAAIQQEAIDAEDAEVVSQASSVIAPQQSQQSQQQPPPEDVPKVFQRNMADRIDAGEEEEIKGMLRDAIQVCPGLFKAVENTLKSQGLKIADLSWESARQLRHKIEQRELEAMAGMLLTRGK